MKARSILYQVTSTTLFYRIPVLRKLIFSKMCQLTYILQKIETFQAYISMNSAALEKSNISLELEFEGLLNRGVR